MKTVEAGRPRTIAGVKADVEQLLERYYNERLVAAGRMDPAYGQLWQVMAEVSRAGGKRLRPYLMLTAYEGLGGKQYNEALHVAAGLELLHTSLLIHDDIIDRDEVRHGAPNVSGRYRELYGGEGGRAAAEAGHFAMSAALLAGDLALSGAYQLVIMSGLSDSDKLLAQRLLGEAVFTVAGGELLDTEAVLGPVEAADSLKIAQLKTASYSFVGPLVTGARLAGAAADDTARLEQYGEALGVSFQLADDLLGLFGNEAVTGKSVTSDLEEGKPTYVMQRAMALAAEAERAKLAAALGRGPVTREMAVRVRQIVEDCGARAETEALMVQYGEEARAALAEAGLTATGQEALNDLVQAVIRRQR